MDKEQVKELQELQQLAKKEFGVTLGELLDLAISLGNAMPLLEKMLLKMKEHANATDKTSPTPVS